MAISEKHSILTSTPEGTGVIVPVVDAPLTPSGQSISSVPDQVWRGAVSQQGSPAPRLVDWAIATSCISAGPVGGDFYDTLRLPNGDSLLLIADVMGKGIPAALIASVAKSVFQTAVRDASTPVELFHKVNELLYEDLSAADMFITAQAVWIDSKHSRLHLVSAGHCPMLVYHQDKSITSVSPESGFPIGVEIEGAYSESIIPISGVDCCVMYTDGVTEALSKAGRSFGQDGLERWLRQVRSTGLSVDIMKEDLELVLEKFSNGTHRKDDRTFLILEHSIT